MPGWRGWGTWPFPLAHMRTEGPERSGGWYPVPTPNTASGRVIYRRLDDARDP